MSLYPPRNPDASRENRCKNREFNKQRAKECSVHLARAKVAAKKKEKAAVKESESLEQDFKVCQETERGIHEACTRTPETALKAPDPKQRPDEVQDLIDCYSVGSQPELDVGSLGC